jgi:dihydroflavonol-4-reductase
MILVTGGTGLVGSQLLFDLTKAGKKVRALKTTKSSMGIVNNIFRGNENLLQNIEWVVGDVTDLFSLEDAFLGVKQVYHCAALVSFHPSDFRSMIKINTEGTANMVNTALDAGIEKFCHVSSAAALGRTDEQNVLTESSVWKTSKNNSGYAISKYGAEREVWRGIEEGLNAFMVNPTIIIGPGNLNSGSTALFGEVLKGLKFYPRGSSGFVDVRDVSSCMLQLMEKNGSTVNGRFIINSENCSYQEVINEVADGFGKRRPSIAAGNALSEFGWRAEAAIKIFSGKKPMITRETARNGQRHWNYSNEKIKKALGIKFIPVKEAVKTTCEILLRENQAEKKTVR